MSSNKRPSLITVTGSTEHLVEVATRKRYVARRRQVNLLKGVPVLIFLCLIFFVMFVVVQVKYSKLLAEEICTARDCIESSIAIRDAMDLEQDPCNDFYAYACGNFPIVHPISEDGQHNSWFHEGELQLSRMAQMILMNVNKINDSKLVENARNFFRSCINMHVLEEKGLTPLYELLEKLGLPKFPTQESAENFNLGRTLGLIQRHVGQDILVQVSVTRGAVRSSFPNDTFMIQVSPAAHLGTLTGIRTDPAELGLMPILSPSKSLLHRIMLIGAVMQNIVMDLKTNYGFEYEYNSTTFSTQAVKILHFTNRLKEIITAANNHTDGNDTDTDYDTEVMTFQELEEYLEGYSPSANASNRIKWADFLTALYGNDNGYWVYDYSLDKVNVVATETFKEYATFLGASHAIQIQRYIWWTIVQGYAKYTNRAMRLAYAHFFESLYGIRSSSSRLRSCVAVTRHKLHNSLAIPARNHFNLAKNTSKVSEMLKYIQTEFAHIVNSLDWMDKETKRTTIEKSKAIKSHIGYEKVFLDEQRLEEYYSGLKFDAKEYMNNILKMEEWKVARVLRLFKQSNISAAGMLGSVTNPLQVNAFYSREVNSIFVPAGILQKPFYYRGLESLNYGAIGSILGHELTHGFDSEGKNYDLHGKWQEELWSPEITKSYDDRAQCFVKQYDKFRFKKNEGLNGSYTLAENIADNGGVRESYYAYQSFVQRNGREPKLPGFENYTHEQLFFLSFANIWCEGFSEAAREVLRKDPHSPNRVRVIATLQNMKEFSEAFKCPKSSVMNPVNKCVIW